ncbi:hypothetical protein [Bartonella raoultii]|uniref:hypothetical protein n=1 Tax=Bartonella raoultii TaxID=1457020 RepID=UPI001FEF325D|nr:hypothetical protein [Bartonella raoultii]
MDKVGAAAAEKAVDAVQKVDAGVAEKVADAAEKAAGTVDKAGADAAEKAVDAVKKVGAGAAEKAADAVNKTAAGVASKASNAVHKAVSDVVKKAADATDLSVQGALQSRESLLENQKTLFKDYDLDKLLHKIRTVLDHNNLKNVQKQFHQLFDKQDSSVYSCAFESALGDENLSAVTKEVGEHSAKDAAKSGADVESHHARVGSHDHKDRLQEVHDHLKDAGENLKEMHKNAKQREDHLQETHHLLEKTYGTNDGSGPQQGKDTSSQELYKKGYDALLAAHYVDAEKNFCAFQQRYQKDPLSDDALFWLAEALLGQKRYHEAAQVYLNVWYADKKKAYTSEILLKLASSMVALEPNKEACTLFAKKAKHSKTLESVFCKPLKRSEVIRGVR